MSTPSPHFPSAPTTSPDEVEIRIVSHSSLFYWWPVWLIGFLMAALTYFDDTRAAIVPAGTEVVLNSHGGGETKRAEGSTQYTTKWENRDSYVLPKGSNAPIDSKTGDPIKPHLHMAHSQSYGVWFAIVLLLVIVITNVPLRGMWSVVIIVVIVLTSVIFGLAGWWAPIFEFFSYLSIHINAGGYLFISLILLTVWLLTFLLFDRQIYMIFTPGQLRVRTEIGGGETAYDTTGMTIQKQRSDLFRHWILGLGSGDLIVNTSGAHAHHFDLPNVLFIGKKVEQIEDMLRERAVVRGR